jgi:hypothetical protein
LFAVYMVAEDTEELYDDLYEDFGGGKQFLKTSLQEIEERLESFKRQEQELKDKVDVLQKEVLPQLHPDVSMW